MKLNNKTLLLFSIVFIFFNTNLLRAQCSQKNIPTPMVNSNNVPSKMIADELMNQYDVVYQKAKIFFNGISLGLSGHHFSGHCMNTVKVVAPLMNKYVFELNPGFNIDSIQVNGVATTSYYNVIDQIYYVDLDTPFVTNEVVNFTIYYEGIPVPIEGGVPLGIYAGYTYPFGGLITYSNFRPFSTSSLLPSKMSLTDKVDSADFFWETNFGVNKQVASSGLFVRVVPLVPSPTSALRFEWKVLNPIAPYTIGYGEGLMAIYKFNAYLPYSGDSVLVMNFLPSSGGELLSPIPKLDSVGLLLTYASELFGDYPFKNEKYGQCYSAIDGGMGQQTLSSISSLDMDIMAHELAHSWFGNSVTCSSWSDVWLHEGFATYFEYLYQNHFYSYATAQAKMQTFHHHVMSEPDGTVFVEDSTNISRLFDQRLSYHKGAAVVHMLRYLVNDDDQFFSMLRAYQDSFVFGNASILQFKDFAADYFSIDLDNFFDQWIFGSGFPTISLNWIAEPETLTLKLSQTSSDPSSVMFFKTPLDIYIEGLTRDTLVRLNWIENYEEFTIPWNNHVVSIKIDPENWIINRVGKIEGEHLGIEERTDSWLQVYPNPTGTVWNLNGLYQPAQVELIDFQGRKISEQKYLGYGSLQVKGENLPAGIYFIRVVTAEKTVYKKVLRW